MKTAAEHWNAVYETRAAEQMSWFQATADMSLALIREGRVDTSKAILDVGAGASTLVDGLLQKGYRDVTLLISRKPLWKLRGVVSAKDRAFSTCVADVTQWNPPRQFALWHIELPSIFSWRSGIGGVPAGAELRPRARQCGYHRHLRPRRTRTVQQLARVSLFVDNLGAGIRRHSPSG